MAGVGSGWFERRSTKMRTDEYPWIDVRHMALSALVNSYVILLGGAMAEVEWKPCHFGGHRPYFQCPRCMGRCCKLYRYQPEVKGTDSYGCQKCLGMVHPVENEGKLERAVMRSNKAFNRQKYDFSRPEGKPRWMRWPTWKRLSDHATESAMARFAYHEKITILLRHLDKPQPSQRRDK